VLISMISFIFILNPGHPERSRGIPLRYLKDYFPGILRLRFASLRMTIHNQAAT
jgi:hypothetical protein